jgi:type I restriction enzyme S subunit
MNNNAFMIVRFSSAASTLAASSRLHWGDNVALLELILHYCNTMGDAYLQNEGKQTTNLASISLSKVRALPIALPPAPEQLRILGELDRRFSVLDQVETTVQASLARCALLRQAILKRAFEGRLVSAPPEPHGPDDQSQADP